MPQETKSMSIGSQQQPAAAHREDLHGWIPDLAGDQEIREALEKAFDYRGDVTITCRDGSIIEGYVFDRRSNGTALADCFVRVLPKDTDQKLAIPYTQIARLVFSGKDTAAGKSFEAWVRKYQQKKAAGESNIRIEPEHLE